MLRCAFALVCVLAVVAAYPKRHQRDTKADVCGYESCPVPKAGMLNVHLVPHTHDDVGWLKTVDQYYYGSRNNIQNAGVQYIIDSVVDELDHDPNKKFIYVETAFFWQWWKEQDTNTQNTVKRLVNNGQLEFIGGAWSMNDEATTHYQCIIDNFTWGLRKLNDSFGTCGQPKIGWQIDPFGHSREQASLMAQLGFDGLFFGRLDYQDKRNRLDTKTMEMIWEGSDSLGDPSDIFTGALYNGYGAPPGFCFDILCGDDPIIDGLSYDNNVNARVDEFLKQVGDQRTHYRTNNIVLTMGGDFNYQDAQIYYKNMDKLVRYVNARQDSGSDVNVFYSTPSCYLKSLHDSNLTWSTKEDDFFPYASDEHAYWTGYFTSRSNLKYYERQGNNLLQMCKQLAATANLGDEDTALLDTLREVMGVMQHHDAVAGTEKQHVADDYSRLLTDGARDCGRVAGTGLAKILDKGNQQPPLLLRSCPLRNISQCDITSNGNFVATVYNPLSRVAGHEVRVPVNGQNGGFTVRDSKGQTINSQVVPIPDTIRNIPGRTATTTDELVFIASDVPALGYKSYYVTKTAERTETSFEVDTKNTESLRLKGTGMTVEFDADGFVSSIRSNTVRDSVAAAYYIGALGDNGASDRRSSGAYIFRPNGTSHPVSMQKAEVKMYIGEIVYEIHQKFNDFITMVMQVYPHKTSSSRAEQLYSVNWIVGPIPVEDGDGKEIVVQYNTDIASAKTFYTDSNGRETIKRTRDFRPTWQLDPHEPVAGNYYPVVSNIAINDANSEMFVLTDRAEGGTSMVDGQLELMIHRRLLHDDAFGVGEALNEEQYGTGLVAVGTHTIMVGNPKDPAWALEKRHAQQETILSLEVLFADASSLSYDSWANNYNQEWSGLSGSVPDNVQILTLEPWKKGQYLLRLEHLLETSESTQSASVNLTNLFTTFDITNARETTLGANQWLDESTRLVWKKETNKVPGNVKVQEKAAPVVELAPKQIRTFVVDVTPKM